MKNNVYMCHFKNDDLEFWSIVEFNCYTMGNNARVLCMCEKEENAQIFMKTYLED